MSHQQREVSGRDLDRLFSDSDDDGRPPAVGRPGRGPQLPRVAQPTVPEAAARSCCLHCRAQRERLDKMETDVATLRAGFERLFAQMAPEGLLSKTDPPPEAGLLSVPTGNPEDKGGRQTWSDQSDRPAPLGIDLAGVPKNVVCRALDSTDHARPPISVIPPEVPMVRHGDFSNEGRVDRFFRTMVGYGYHRLFKDLGELRQCSPSASAALVNAINRPIAWWSPNTRRPSKVSF